MSYARYLPCYTARIPSRRALCPTTGYQDGAGGASVISRNES